MMTMMSQQQQQQQHVMVTFNDIKENVKDVTIDHVLCPIMRSRSLI